MVELGTIQQFKYTQSQVYHRIQIYMALYEEALNTIEETLKLNEKNK
jgi:hypothetical protein